MTVERMSLMLVVVLGAGCPKGSSAPVKTADSVATCDDVGDTAAKLGVLGAMPRPRPAIARDQPPPGNWLGQAAMPEPDEQDLAGIWRGDCVEHGWPQAQIDCFTSATHKDQARDCATGVAPVAAEPDADPACVAAAEHGAEILANDIGVTGEDREDVLSRAVPAILEPCLAQRFSDELLECLTDPEMTESFGICSFAEGEGWERLDASLRAEGFGPGED